MERQEPMTPPLDDVEHEDTLPPPPPTFGGVERPEQQELNNKAGEEALDEEEGIQLEEEDPSNQTKRKKSLLNAAAVEKLAKDTTEKLHQVWDEMGLSEEERQLQLNSLAQEVESVFHQKVSDEYAIRDEYLNAAKKLESEIDEVSKQLGMERQFFPHGESGNLMLKLTWLRSHLVQFKAVKEERMAKLEEMRHALTDIWNELGQGQEAEFANLEHFLTLEGMEEFHGRLVQAQHERTIRIASIQETIRDIIALFEELEFDVITEFDKAIMEGGDSLGIDMDIVEKLSQRARELTKEKLSRTEALKQLGAKIHPLWEKLEIDANERDQFFMNNRGLGLGVIRECQKELQRMLQLKQERMGDLIQDAQEKIQALWDELHYDDEQREAFTQAYMLGPICEETLEAHEEEIAVLSVKAELYRPILKMVEKYYQLCEERNEYEEKIKDSSRLLSRRGGSALREEEQQRQRVTKGIPRVIEKVKAAIAEYEELHGPFLLGGVPFVETLDANEAAHQEKLEEERLAKQRAKQSKEDPLRSAVKSAKKTPAPTRQRPPLSSRND